MARRFGVQTEGIELWLLGGMARLDGDAPSPKADGLIAVAGPLSSLLLGAAGIGTAVGLEAMDAWPLAAAMIGWLGVVNVIIALFNLLPGAPLDGGRILRARALVPPWRPHPGDPRGRAGRADPRLGDRHRRRLDDVPGLGWPVHPAHRRVPRHQRQGRADWRPNAESRLAGITVDEVTWYGVAEATADTDAETMLGQRGPASARRASSPSRTGTVGSPGSSRRSSCGWCPSTSGRSRASTQLMVPFNRVARAEPDEPLAPVLARLTSAGALHHGVAATGRLVGVVARDALQRRLPHLAA